MITLPHSCCTCKVITEREPIEWRRKKEERSRSSKGQYSGDGGRAEKKRKKSSEESKMKRKDTRKEKRGMRKKEPEGCYQALRYLVCFHSFISKKNNWHFFPGLSIFLSIIPLKNLRSVVERLISFYLLL